MKYILVFLIILFISIPAFSEDMNKAFKVGFQADSDTYMGLIVKAASLEMGLKAKWIYWDAVDETNGLVAGAHLSYLLNGKKGISSFGTGIDFRVGLGGFGGQEYNEYVDAYLRLNYNYHLSENFMLSALFYPFSLTSRDMESDNSYTMTITIPSAAIAAAVFF